MITITHATIVYGFLGNSIHVAGITAPNTPIAEIDFSINGDRTYEYMTYWGEIFPSFSLAFEAMVNQNARRNAYEVTMHEQYLENVMIADLLDGDMA